MYRRLIHQCNHTSNRIDYLNCLLSTCRMIPGLSSSKKKYLHYSSLLLLVSHSCCLLLLVLNYSTSYWSLVKVFLLEYCVSLRAYLLIPFEVSCPTTIGFADHILDHLWRDPRHMAFQVVSFYPVYICALYDDSLFYALFMLDIAILYATILSLLDRKIKVPRYLLD